MNFMQRHTIRKKTDSALNYTLISLLSQIYIIDDFGGLQDRLKNILVDEGVPCPHCYRISMEKLQNNFWDISDTLFLGIRKRLTYS